MIDLASYLPSSLETLWVIESIGRHYKIAASLVLHAIAKFVRQRAKGFHIYERYASPGCHLHGTIRSYETLLLRR
jgi:hypothetical protein